MAKLLKFGDRGYEFVNSSSEALDLGILDVSKVRSQEAYLLLNSTYTTTSTKFGGIVIVDEPTATQTTVTSSGFVAGVDGVSNPLVNVASSVGFAAGDIVLVSGSESNDSLYEVLSTAAGLIRFKGIGLTPLTQNFFQDQLTSITGAVGTVTKVRVSVLRSRLDGSWEGVSGSSTNSFIFSAVGLTKALRKTINTSNTPYTLISSDECIFIDATDGNIVVNMPAIVSSGTTARIYRFKRLDSSANTIQINGSGSNIDGSSSYYLPGRYSACSLVDNGSEWSIF